MQVFRHRVIERELAFLHQLGDGDTAETLRLRALHEHIVHRDGTFLLHIGISDAAGLLYTVVVEHTDGTRQCPAVDKGLQHLLCKGGLGVDDFGPGRCRQTARQS